MNKLYYQEDENVQKDGVEENAGSQQLVPHDRLALQQRHTSMHVMTASK